MTNKPRPLQPLVTHRLPELWESPDAFERNPLPVQFACAVGLDGAIDDRARAEEEIGDFRHSPAAHKGKM